MGISKVSILVLLIIVAVTSSCSKNVPEEFSTREFLAKPLKVGQEVSVGNITFKLGRVFIWVSKNSGTFLPKLKPANNTCSYILYELDSVHDNSIALADVTICKIEGNMYYIYLPITS
jgi:hypothetical protein